MHNRQIDILVAEEVLGWTWEPKKDDSRYPAWNSHDGLFYHDVPEFTTSPDSTNFVMDWLKQRLDCFHLEYHKDSSEWVCGDCKNQNWLGSGGTWMMAVCLAALKVAKTTKV